MNKDIRVFTNKLVKPHNFKKYNSRRIRNFISPPLKFRKVSPAILFVESARTVVSAIRTLHDRSVTYERAFSPSDISIANVNLNFYMFDSVLRKLLLVKFFLSSSLSIVHSSHGLLSFRSFSFWENLHILKIKKKNRKIIGWIIFL